ncbi:MAG TPA: PEP-utilizing enzyme [Acidimicrobiales bacterium]|nr:PEP-utilizing enzyme [Acidimicrobiales bacterium]
MQQLTHPDFVSNAANLSLVATGTPVSPGAASGLLCLSADSVLAADERGDKTVLVCSETTPADEIGMRLAEGIITARGGISSHAAVVARGWGIPAVVGISSLEIKNDHVMFGGVTN